MDDLSLFAVVLVLYIVGAALYITAGAVYLVFFLEPRLLSRLDGRQTYQLLDFDFDHSTSFDRFIQERWQPLLMIAFLSWLAVLLLLINIVACEKKLRSVPSSAVKRSAA